MRRLVKFLRVGLVSFISALLLGCGSEVSLVVDSLEGGVSEKIEGRLRKMGKDLHGKVQVKKTEDGHYDVFIPIKYETEYFDYYKKRSKRLREVRDGMPKGIIRAGFVYGFACTQAFLPPSGIMASRTIRHWGPKEKDPYGASDPTYKWSPPIVDREKINSIEVEVWVYKRKPPSYKLKRDEYGNEIYEEEPPLRIGSLKLSYDAKPEEMKWENLDHASKQVEKGIWQKAIVEVK